MLTGLYRKYKNQLLGLFLSIVLLSSGGPALGEAGILWLTPAEIAFAQTRAPTPTHTPTPAPFTQTPTPTSTQTPTPTGTFLNCAGTSVGFIPLSDLSATQFYKDQEGGLYGNGLNNPPGNHLLTAQAKNSAITPRSPTGAASSTGKIGLVSIGMSNTRQEFAQFLPLADADPQKSPKVVLVNGAQGGQVAEEWALNGDGERPWSILSAEIEKAGLTSQQVQVAWIKLSNFNKQSTSVYPAFATKLRDDMAVTVKRLKTKFPNLQIAYFSSRIYAGYTTHQLNPEPVAYESALGVRWLIEDQLAGGGATGTTYANAPVLLWGPYLWADGLGPDGIPGGVPGRSDGLEWECADYEDDGTHPSLAGEVKVANLLLSFFKTNALAKTWFTTGSVNNPTPTAVITPTKTPTSTQPSGRLPSPTPTLVQSATPTPTSTLTPTATKTSTPTPTIPAGGSPSPTPTPTQRIKGSPTPTPTLPVAGSPTPTPTPTANPLPTSTPSPTPAAIPSVLVNGSFETDGDGNGIPDGWAGSRLNSTDGRLASSLADGAFIFKLTPASSNVDYKGLKQSVDLTGGAGETLQASLWAKTDLANANGSLRIRVSFFTATGTRQDVTQFLTEDPLGGYQTVSVTAPFSYTKVIFFVEMALTNSNAYFDDVSFGKS